MLKLLLIFITGIHKFLEPNRPLTLKMDSDVCNSFTGPYHHECQGYTAPTTNHTGPVLHLPFWNTIAASRYQITMWRLQVLYHLTDTICLITVINQAGECAKEAHLFMCSLVNLVHHFRTTICMISAWQQQFLQYCFCNIVTCCWSGALAQRAWRNLCPAVIAHVMTSFTL